MDGESPPSRLGVPGVNGWHVSWIDMGGFTPSLVGVSPPSRLEHSRLQLVACYSPPTKMIVALGSTAFRGLRRRAKTCSDWSNMLTLPGHHTQTQDSATQPTNSHTRTDTAQPHSPPNVQPHVQPNSEFRPHVTSTNTAPTDDILAPRANKTT
jgi:hypothetical protein